MKIIGLLKVCFLLGFIGWNLYLMWSSVNCRHNVRHISSDMNVLICINMLDIRPGLWRGRENNPFPKKIKVFYKIISYQMLSTCILLPSRNLYLMWSSVNCRHNVRHIRTIPFPLPPDWDGGPLNFTITHFL
jgi:hypothetical protein